MKISAALLLAALLIASAACNRNEPSTPPVATPSVTMNKDRAAMGSPLRVTYKFDVAAGATFDADYLVFVHVMGPDGDTLWQDDHAPATPTSQWTAGQSVEYTRTVFVPNVPYVGEASMRIGLYNPAGGQRLALNATEAGRREYLVGKINLLPEAENVFLIYKDGWHPTEVDANNPLAEWQWTRKTATISFRNPKRDAVLYLESDARVDLFTQPQQVTVTVTGQPVGTFAADSKDPTLRTFAITAAQFGSGEMSEIVFDLDRTFSGSPGDTRELGIRVFHVFIEPK